MSNPQINEENYVSNDNTFDGYDEIMPGDADDNSMPEGYDQFMGVGTDPFADVPFDNSPTPEETGEINEDDLPFSTEPDPKVVPFHPNSSIEWMMKNNAQDIIDHNVTQQKQKRSADMGLTPEQSELADKCGLLGNSEVDNYINIPAGMRDSKLIRFASDVSRAYQFPEGTTVLTALASFSAVSSLCYSVEYEDGSPLPIGMYLCAGQPPSTRKSQVLNIFTKVLQRGLGILKRDIIAENAKLSKSDVPHPLPSQILSNATPEAIEQAMEKACSGRFIIASSEQGAIDKVLNIGVKDRSTDSDLVLKGFVGELHSSARVTRVGFTGEVFGTILLIAQPETAKKVITNSNGMGIAERFLFASEPSLLGKRKPYMAPVDKAMQDQYNGMVKSIIERYKRIEPCEIDELKGLRLCDEGYQFLADLFVIREPKLGEYNAKNAHLMTGALGKIDQQIMKIAAVLHIAETTSRGGEVHPIIDKKWVEQATYLAFDMNKKLENILIDEGEIGDEAKEMLVVGKFDRKKSITHTELTGMLKNNRLFTDRADATETIKSMLEKEILGKRGKSYFLIG